MTQPTTDTRAVVRAIDALTTQVGRVADAMTTPVTADALATDDAPTTGDDATCHRMESRTCPPSYNGPCGERPCARYESDDPRPWLDTAEPSAAEENACLAHIKGACDGTTRDCAFAVPGTVRRRSLRVLINRLNKGLALTPDEAQLLARHVATEICNANRAAQAEDLLRVAHETSNKSETERANAVVRAERYEAERDAARNRLTFMEDSTLPDLHRRTNADRETIGRWRTRATGAEAAIERVHTLVKTYEQWAHEGWQPDTTTPDVVAREFRAALDYSETEPAPLVHPNTEQQASAPDQVDDIAAMRSAVARTQERCQAGRDREGPGGMINATQVLGLLSPTWPDGNYEAPAPGSTTEA